MASSFRLDPKLEWKLVKALEQTGASRSELIRAAIEKYCEEVLAGGEQTPYERLVASGFKPINVDLGPDYRNDKQARRQKLRERAIKDNH